VILRPVARAAHALFVVGLVVGGLVVSERAGGGPSAAVDAAPAPTSTTVSSASLPQHRVSYRGVSVQAPTSWPVVNLDADPTACVRMDRPAVYLGTPSGQQSCPARAFATADTIWLATTTAADTVSTAAPSARVERRSGRAVRTRWDAVSRAGLAVLPDSGVSIRTTSPSGELTTSDVVDTLGSGAATTPSTPQTPPTSASAPTTIPAAPAAYVRSAVAAAAPKGKSFTGMWFDTCAAPSASAMATWKASSPYAAVGVYIGGALRGCGQPNLTKSWVSTVTGQGWGLAPIYVGLQAPCVNASLSTFTASNAASTGTSSADDAAEKARALGLAAGSTIHYDLENYATGNASCTAAVLKMVSAWTTEIRKQGFSAGVYGNVGSLMTDMSKAHAAGSTTFVAPDQIWYALWDELQTTSTGSSSFPDSYWSGQRLHQYRGDFSETWGGVTMNLDANWSTATMPGNPTQVSYGSGILGPGSAGFAFTGPMSYWRPSPGSGVAGRGYWTRTAGSTTESSGATWSPSLSPGTYAVDVNVPGSIGATGIGHYTVTDATGKHPITVNQSMGSGYRTIGSGFVVRSGQPLRLHLADNEPSSTTGVIAADAARFRLLTAAPGAPGGTWAVAGDARAAVHWTAAAANGAPLTGYRVVASPGGRSVTVAGTATTATITGLVNGTSYTFAVTATNAVGSSRASAASNAVVPVAAGRIVPVAAARILDTRRGATANSRRTALRPGESLSVRVAGVTGSPVPAGATSAYANLTVTSPTGNGYLSVSPDGSTSSAINFTAGRTLPNLSLVRLRPDGTTTVTNHSSGTVQVILDVQAAVRPGTSGSLWSSVTPTRVADTRSGAPANTRAVALAAGSSTRFRIAGVSGSPVPAGAKAAALNLTVTQPARAGYLAVGGATTSTVSNVNFLAGQSIANLAVVQLAADGTVLVHNGSSGTIQVVIDVQGYAASSGRTSSPVSPERLVDTRVGAPSNPLKVHLSGGASVTVRVADVIGSPVPAGVVAATLNLTVVTPTASGQLGVSPTGTTRSSVANFTRGSTVASLATAALSSAGTVVITNQSAGTLDLVVDVQGFVGP